jgi:hypothetical protein
MSSIQTTKAGASLATQGTGSFKGWKEVRVCNDAIKNIIGAGYLRSMGYGLSLLRVPRIVELDTGEETAIDVEYASNGMPFASLQDLLHLPNISQRHEEGESEVLFSDNMGEDEVELLHRRTGHYSRSVLLEGYRRMLFIGSGLRRQHLSNKYKKNFKKVLCSGCVKGKITRKSFKEKVKSHDTRLNS